MPSKSILTVITSDTIGTTVWDKPNDPSKTDSADRVDENRRVRKFIFFKKSDYLLLQIGFWHDSHSTMHGKKKDESFEKVRDKFIANFPDCVWLWYNKPTMKPVRNKLRLILAESHIANQNSGNSSGIEKFLGPAGHLLDHFISKANHVEEERRQDRSKATAGETELFTTEERTQKTFCCLQIVRVRRV